MAISIMQKISKKLLKSIRKNTRQVKIGKVIKSLEMKIKILKKKQKVHWNNF